MEIPCIPSKIDNQKIYQMLLQRLEVCQSLLVGVRIALPFSNNQNGGGYCFQWWQDGPSPPWRSRTRGKFEERGSSSIHPRSYRAQVPGFRIQDAFVDAGLNRASRTLHPASRKCRPHENRRAMPHVRSPLGLTQRYPTPRTVRILWGSVTAVRT